MRRIAEPPSTAAPAPMTLAHSIGDRDRRRRGLVAIALHFIARSRPVAEIFPDGALRSGASDSCAHAIARADRLLLLLLRVLAICCSAWPWRVRCSRPAGVLRRIVIADRSRAVANIATCGTACERISGDGDALIVFDSSAARVAGTAIDSLARERRTWVAVGGAQRRDSGGRARRAARPTRSRWCSFLRSPTTRWTTPPREFGATWRGTHSRRAASPAPQRSDVGPLSKCAPQPTMPSRRACRCSAMSVSSSPVRVVRGRTTPEDSAWARAGGHVLVHWPANDVERRLGASSDDRRDRRRERRARLSLRAFRDCGCSRVSGRAMGRRRACRRRARGWRRVHSRRCRSGRRGERPYASRSVPAVRFRARRAVRRRARSARPLSEERVAALPGPAAGVGPCAPRSERRCRRAGRRGCWRWPHCS